MKYLTFIFLIAMFIVIPFSCDDNDDKTTEEDHTTFTGEDTITIYGWLDSFPKIEMRDTVDCNSEINLAVMDSLVKYVTYVIKDKCLGENSSFVETPDEFREIRDVIKDGNTFVGTYLNNYAPRSLYCRGESGIGCPYSILTDNFTTFTLRDSVVQDTLNCDRINQPIYVNTTNKDITVKVTILEKCQNGTLNISIRDRNNTSIRANYRVNQTPSTTRIRGTKNSIIMLKSNGNNGKVIYKLGIG